MRKESRLILALAALLLLPVFFLPLWSIGVVAPQYSDGLGMYIMIDDVVGHERHDIQNLNILNHYIGMQPIVPEEVPALDIMPWAVAFLIGFGLLAAVVGRRFMLYGWLGSFGVLGAAGMVEFYRWLYDYGHNLDPTAPIKIPGMTYQPPLIGTEQLLNMHASSWPSWGTLFITLSILLGGLVLWNEFRPIRFLQWKKGQGDRTEDRAVRTRSGSGQLPTAAAIVSLVALLGACGQAPQASAEAESYDQTRSVLAGHEDDYCGGTIGEIRFGGELVTTDGDTFRFLSTECMAGFVAENGIANGQVRSMKVVEYTHGSRLIDAREARFVRSEQHSSPSGLDILATDRELIAYNLRRFFGGDELSWDEVVELVRHEWDIR